MAPRSERNLPQNFGERIRGLRARVGLTQTQLADLLGVSFASVNRWENGQSRPSALAWRRISAAEDHGIGAFRESVEPSITAASESTIIDQPVRIDFLADSEVVRAVAEAERLAHG